jgi:hypothetical protein
LEEKEEDLVTKCFDDEETKNMLRVDAILLAAGLSSYDLHESFDFEPWFLQILVPSLQHPRLIAGIPVLSRRIVWLIGCWLAQLSSQVFYIYIYIYIYIYNIIALHLGFALCWIRNNTVHDAH